MESVCSCACKKRLGKNKPRMCPQYFIKGQNGLNRRRYGLGYNTGVRPLCPITWVTIAVHAGTSHPLMNSRGLAHCRYFFFFFWQANKRCLPRELSGLYAQSERLKMSENTWQNFLQHIENIQWLRFQLLILKLKRIYQFYTLKR